MSPPLVRVFADRSAAARAAADLLCDAITTRNASGRRAVLGLATGRSPIDGYRELVARHRAGLSFREVETFNLDEYHPISATHPASFHAFMDAHLFGAIDLPRAQRHLLDGSVALADAAQAAADYEAAIAAAGGLDVQLIGIGRNGHVGFNEPGSPRDSRTRRVALAPETRADAAAAFGTLEHVPTHALTMGIATILEARRIVLLAFGVGKAAALKAALEAPPRAELPASFLQDHPDVTVLADEAAASALQRGV